MWRHGVAIPVVVTAAVLAGCQDATTVAVRNDCATPIEVDAEQDAARVGAEGSWRELAPGEARAVRAITVGADDVYVAVRGVGVESHPVDELPSPEALGAEVDADVIVVIDGDGCGEPGD